MRIGEINSSQFLISSNTIEIKSPTRREIEEESKIIDEDEHN